MNAPPPYGQMAEKFEAPVRANPVLQSYTALLNSSNGDGDPVAS